MKRIQIASTGKRIAAALIDLAIAIGISCLFYFLVFYKAVSSVQHFDSANETINEEKIKSRLYVKNDKGEIVTITIYNPDISYQELGDKVKKFYTDYLHAKDNKYDEYWYNTHVLFLDDKDQKYKDETITKPERILFEWKDNIATRKSDTTDEELKTFYTASFGTATTRFYLFDPVLSLSKKIKFGKLRSWIYASLVGTVIPYLIIPLCIKNNKTIGKLIFGLIVLTDDGYYYKKWKNIIRYLAFYIIEVFGGVVTIGLTLVLSSCLALFTLKKRALHDYIAFSVVVNEKYSVFFINEDEEAKYKELAVLKGQTQNGN